MPRTKLAQVFKDDDVDLESRIIQAIQKVGPKNVSLLSRMTGAHAETIRYKLKKRFKRLGFRLHAVVDHEKLGLTQAFAELYFSKGFEGSAAAFLASLNELAYLTYYAKLIPQGSYAAIFLPPAGRVNDVAALLSFLRDRGVLDSFTFGEVLSNRQNSMNPGYFNFQAGNWDIDWSRVRLEEGTRLPTTKRQQRIPVDRYDLLLVKEFQKDAFQHVVGIARKLKVHQKTLEYHYRSHVQKQGMISSYRVRWMHETERSVAHSVMLAWVVFKELDSDFERAQAAISRIPFLWAEYLLKDGAYAVLLSIPVKEATATFDYLAEAVPQLDGRVEIKYVKRDREMLYTVPFHMFDGRWVFDLEATKSKLAAMSRRTKKRT